MEEISKMSEKKENDDVGINEKATIASSLKAEDKSVSI